MHKWEQPGFFRTPTSVDDAKAQLRKEKKLLKRAQTALSDAETAKYSLGVKIAADDIALRTASIAHFEAWLRAKSSASEQHHATKKSPAQLQREIDEALARPRTAVAGAASAFEEAKVEEALVEKEMSEAQAAIDAFPRGPTGLTPDAVKATPEWRAAKTRVDKAFARLRAFNAVFVKRFAKELRAERAERTRERERRSR